MKYSSILAISLLLNLLIAPTIIADAKTKSPPPFKKSDPNAPKSANKPDHIVIMVFDQMRPDYIDRFNLKTFKKLRDKGTNYPNAYVGHLSAVTVVSHLVLNTGLLPKYLPWQDDVFWDAEGIVDKKDKLYATDHLTNEQILKAMATLDQKKLLTTKIKNKLKGKVVAIGQKFYAALTMGGPTADSIITLSKKNGTCVPDGVQVPEYIKKNERFTLNCSQEYGTQESLYPLDGNRFYPGTDVRHYGGDVWVADAAVEVLNHEDWSGLFLTFGSIDKIGHMMGEEDGKRELSFESPTNLEKTAQIADSQLEKVLDTLQQKKLLERTLLVITADHGGQTNTKYYGNGKSESIGKLENLENTPYTFWANHVAKTDQIKLAYHDTGMRFWLKDPNHENRDRVLKKLKEISGVTHIYFHDKSIDDYFEVFNNLKQQSQRFQKWATTHDNELADTVGGKTGPDFVVFLEDNAGYGAIGNHGGGQENVQRIPMIVVDPSEPMESNPFPLRLVDLLSLISRKLSL